MICFSFSAHISLDNQAFKELVQQEIDKIKEKLIEFAKYMREIKVQFLEILTKNAQRIKDSLSQKNYHDNKVIFEYTAKIFLS